MRLVGIVCPRGAVVEQPGMGGEARTIRFGQASASFAKLNRTPRGVGGADLPSILVICH